MDSAMEPAVPSRIANESRVENVPLRRGHRLGTPRARRRRPGTGQQRAGKLGRAGDSTGYGTMDAVTSAHVVHTPLVACALETERHVAGAGWDQPPRLFALVRTADLFAREPHLRPRLGDGARDPLDLDEGALSAVEQEGMPRTSSLESLLGRVGGPAEVDGVALAVERLVVPPEAERDLPQDPQQASERLAADPRRKDVRLLVAVLRDGQSACLLRQRDHDRDDEVALGAEIAPGLVHALLATLAE